MASKNSETLRHLVKAWEYASDDVRPWIELAIASQYDVEF
jgi:hypothetical protein